MKNKPDSMKANNGKGNNPLRDNWITPSWLYDDLKKQYKFEFDCCATTENKKCRSYSSDFEKIYAMDRTAWMNPPFSIVWKMFVHFFKVVKKGVAIYRCDNFETALWQDIIFPNASWVFVPNRRISFEGLDGDGARFPSALIGYHVPISKFVKGVALGVINNVK